MLENTGDDGKINWVPISLALNNRTAHYLQQQYKNYKRSLKTYTNNTPLTDAEKATIVQRKRAWPDGKIGLWPQLAEEMGGRDPRVLRDYWKNTGSKI